MEGDVETVGEPLRLSSLPNELLMNILTPLTTLELLPVTSVCHRIHDLAVRIITYRLAVAAGLNGNQLLLECYPPSQRLTEPHLCCTHIGTHGLSESMLDQDLAKGCPPGQLLHELKSLYSSFQLHRRPRKNTFRQNYKGDIPGSRTYISRADEQLSNSNSTQPSDPNTTTTPTSNNNTTTASSTPSTAPTAPTPAASPPASGHHTLITPTGSQPLSNVEPRTLPNLYQKHPRLDSPPSEPSPEPVVQHAHLEAGVLFAQLCAETTIAMVAPGTNTFIGFQDVTKGVLRVWRNWLADRAAEQEPSKSPTDEPLAAHRNVHGGSAATPAAKFTNFTDSRDDKEGESTGEDGKDTESDKQRDIRADPSVLWIGHGFSVGVRFGVRELKWRRRPAPVLMHVDEDAPVSYEIRYDELLVRTSDLLLALERADLRKRVDTGKAVWFGSWTTAPQSS